MKNKNWSEISKIGLIAIIKVDDFFVRVYENRLAIWHKYKRRLTWEEVQFVKQQIWGDKIAVEVYPAESAVVNERHTRHLWWSDGLEQKIKSVCVHEEFSKEIK